MELVLSTGRAIAYAIIDPLHLVMLTLMGIIFYSKNRRIALMQRVTIGESINSPLELTLSQIVIGILVGTVGSIALSMLGIVLDQNSGIEVLFLLSFVLLFVKKKFIKFAYTGTVLGVLSLVLNGVALYTNTNIYLKINISTLVSFIGVIYIMEAFLVILDGSRGAIPVFTRKGDKILGGFAFNRYWPLPVAIFLAISSISISNVASFDITTPNWWPIINRSSTLQLISTAVLASIPMYGMINYTAITFTKDKRLKPIWSGVGILVYGISLILIAMLVEKGIGFEIMALLYIPLAYEGMLKVNKLLEDKGENIYVSDDEGICVLEVSPTSQVYEAGIRRGDKILQVNKREICSEIEVLKILKESLFSVDLMVKKISGEIIEYSVSNKKDKLGLLLVPKTVKREESFRVDEEAIQKILKSIKKK